MINRVSLCSKWALVAIVLTTILLRTDGVGISPISLTAHLIKDKVKVGHGVSVIPESGAFHVRDAFQQGD